MNLIPRLLKQSIIGLIVTGLLIFVPAGTWSFWRGWVFIAVFTGLTVGISVYLALRDPVLLERRLKTGPGAETRPMQKAVISLAFVGFFALPVVSVLDYRFGLSNTPAWVSIFGDFLVALGLAIDFRVLMVNSYGASTVKSMEGQKVISTGPYAVVRHPMYTGALIMLAGMPLALGSYLALAFIPLFAVLLILRILDEETMLRGELDGYVAYMQRVRHRLVPGLW